MVCSLAADGQYLSM